MSDYEIENQMVPFSFFQSVIEMLPVAINIINEEQVSVLANALYSELFSWKQESPFSGEIEQVFLFKTAINTMDCKVTTITGEERDMRLMIEPLFDHADVIGAVVVVQDITNVVVYQKENEKLLKSVEELKRLIQEKQEMEIDKPIVAKKVQETDANETFHSSEESLRAEIDYTSRDDTTWLAVRTLRNNIYNQVPTYLYGEKGLEKRTIVKQTLCTMMIKHVEWFELKTLNQLPLLKTLIETNHNYIAIDIENKTLLQSSMDMLAPLSENENCKWIMIADEPIPDKAITGNIDIIRIPSLRERKADIFLLLDKLVRNGVKLSNKVKKRFIQYHWPHNIRELRSVISYANSMRSQSENIITLEHIGVIGQQSTNDTSAQSGKEKNALDMLLQSMDKSNQSMPDIFEKIEKTYIEQILQKSEYNITHTANKLGIKRQALQYKLKKYCLAPEEELSKLN